MESDENVAKIRDALVRAIRKISVDPDIDSLTGAVVDFIGLYGLAAVRWAILIYWPASGTALMSSPSVPLGAYGEPGIALVVPMAGLEVYR